MNNSCSASRFCKSTARVRRLVKIRAALETPSDWTFSALLLRVASRLRISHNRMIRQADRRAHLLAEQETTLDLHTVGRIGRHLGLPEDPTEEDADILVRRTDDNAMMRSLEQQLPRE